MSTTSESQPRWAISSAEKPLGMPHHPLMTALPAFQTSLTRFARMPALLGFDDRIRSGRSRQPAREKSSFEDLLVDDIVADRVAVENAQQVLHRGYRHA